MEETQIQKALKKAISNRDAAQELVDFLTGLRKKEEEELRKDQPQSFDISMIRPKSSKPIKIFPGSELPENTPYNSPIILAVKDSGTVLVGGTIKDHEPQNSDILVGTAQIEEEEEQDKPYFFFQLYKNHKKLCQFWLQDNALVQDAFFVKALNCFFLMASGMLYRKDIDTRKAYFCMDCSSFYSQGCLMRYSDGKRRLVVLGQKKISVVDLMTKKIDFGYPHQITRNIVDCALFGDNQDHLVVLSHSGKIYTIKYSGLGSLKCFKLSEYNQRVIGCRLAVSDDSRFLCVLGKNLGLKAGNKLLFFEIVKYGLELSSVCDFSKQVSHKHSNLCFYKQIANSYVFVGFSKSSKKDIFFGVFNPTDESSTELREKRCSSKQAYPIRVQRMGHMIMMVGKTLLMNWLIVTD